MLGCRFAKEAGRRGLAVALAAGLFASSAPGLAAGRAAERSERAGSADRVGALVGYAAMNELVRTRLLDETDPRTPTFALGVYLGAAGTDDLISLLGVEVATAGKVRYQNGDPNALNLVLWRMVISGFAAKAAEACAPSSHPELEDFALSAPAFVALRRVCAWNAPGSDHNIVTADDMAALWQTSVGFAAPYAEMSAWRRFFLAPDSPFAASDAKTAVAAMITTMLLNPYVLLRH